MQLELDLDSLKNQTEKNLKRNQILLLLLFATGLVGIVMFILLAPDMTPEDKTTIYRIP